MISKEEQEKLNDELLEASENGRLEEVKELIEKGAEVEARNNWHWTPLQFASNYGYLELVKYLIEEANADVETHDKDGLTPLQLASGRGQLKVVKYLIEEAKAEVEAKDYDGLTPLYLASWYGQLKVVKYLEVVKYLFLEQNALMPTFGMFQYSKFMKEKMGRETEAQSLFEYFLQNKSRYKPEDIQDFKTRFLELKMSEEDSKNLKSIVKFL